MSTLTKIWKVFIFIAILIPMITAICRFFSIEPSTYIPYTSWFIGLALFYAFMPNRVGEMFH